MAGTRALAAWRAADASVLHSALLSLLASVAAHPLPCPFACACVVLQLKPLIKVETVIEAHGRSRVEYSVKVRIDMATRRGSLVAGLALCHLQASLQHASLLTRPRP